jgi:hypothetical protein
MAANKRIFTAYIYEIVLYHPQQLFSYRVETL